MATLLAITVLLPIFREPGSCANAQARGAQRARLDRSRSSRSRPWRLSLTFLVAFRSDVTAPQFAFAASGGRYGLSWIERPDIRFALGLDGLSIWLFELTSLLMITAIAASWESITERAPLYYAFLLALQTGLLGLFASLDVVLFYIFFEFTLIPLFFLIGLWGGPQRRRAAVTFFLYTLAGSLLTFAQSDRARRRALSALARQHPHLFDPRGSLKAWPSSPGTSGGTPSH